MATRTSPLMRLVEGKERLHESVHLSENTAGGVAAAFQEDGFVKPDRVALWSAGQHAGTLVSPRSAAEYGQSTNGAGAGEQAVSLDLAAGDLPTAIAALGTDIDDPVGGLDQIEVMFNDDDGVAFIHQALQHPQQQIYIVKVQPSRRFIKDIQSVPSRTLTQLASQLNSLCFAPR